MLARRIVDECLRISENDNVTIFFYPHNLPLVEGIADACFKKGADVLLNLYTDRFLLSYMTQLSVESLRQPSVFCRTLSENSTAEIWMDGTYDPSILRKISAEKSSAAGEGEAKAHWPVSKEKKVKNLSVGSALVTKPRAKTYGFNYVTWNRMMKEASNVNYHDLAQRGRKLKEALSGASTIRITGPVGTDLKVGVSGRKWMVSDGIIDETDIQEENFMDEIPAGSIYTAPLEDSAEGRITFNTAVPYSGRRYEKIGWTFTHGKVTSFTGDERVAPLKREWAKSSGDKDRIAYLGLGFNPKAKPGFTVNNIVSGTVSVGIGGNQDIGGKNEPGFSFVSTIRRATVEADGIPIIKKGEFVRSFKIPWRVSFQVEPQ
ncbi:MAG: aminopeptidase [Thaumarchaeota archaeon]|nr:aminopeptidase [Nitrososphaerota archaeon]